MLLLLVQPQLKSAGVEPVTTNVDERLSVSKTSDVELHSYEGRSITQLQ